MNNGRMAGGRFLVALGAVLAGGVLSAQEATTAPTKVYVPYEDLKKVFEKENQGVFLPYEEFQRLWRAAAGAPAQVAGAPVPYLISTARFTGQVGAEVARLRLQLTVDILADGWIEVPLGLGNVAVTGAAFEGDEKNQPLLRVADGQYLLLARGKGRKVLAIDFVCQLAEQPGLKILRYRMPPSAIASLDLLIPEENVKVDVDPMLAATTSPEEHEGKKCTRLQAFLGAAEQVSLSWKPKAEAAEELEPVVLCDQMQHLHVAEGLIQYTLKLQYDIRRRGVDAFTVQLPGGFGVTAVEGANVSKWDVQAVPAESGRPAAQTLQVKLFSPAKGEFALLVKMERFLQEAQAEVPLVPVLTHQALRQTGQIAITHTSRRSVDLRDPKNLARVDVGRLPEDLRGQAGVVAYRFISPDYAGTLVVAAVDPRLSVRQLWALGVGVQRLELRGRLDYQVERAGVFQLAMNLPEPWKVLSVGPDNLVDDWQLSGSGPARKLTILLKREMVGSFSLVLSAQADRATPESPVEFALPMPDAEYVQAYAGQAVLWLASQFRAEVESLDQLRALSVAKAENWQGLPGLQRVMAFEFQALDGAKPAGAKFRIALKPPQVSASVYRLVDLQPGFIQQEAVLRYHVLYAPVDTFYLTMPAALAEGGVQITGADIKEKPRIDALPADQAASAPASAPAAPATAPAGGWAYYKVVLQSPVLGDYDLRVTFRRPFQVAPGAAPVVVVVEPVLAAGKLSDQSGTVAVAKDPTLALGEPTIENLLPADPSAPSDLPYEPHRRAASIAFKYSAPPFALSIPVAAQKEAAVFTTIVQGAVVEQVLGRDGALTGRALYVLSTSRGDRMPIVLPAGTKLYAVLLNGKETPVEAGPSPDQRIVRLPPSAGQVSRLVLEVSYGQDKASASKLTVPSLPDDIPVQQTLWRLYVPQDRYVLAYDRTFSLASYGASEALVQELSNQSGQAVAFKLPPQGRQWNFLRQGAPKRLTVRLADREYFCIAVWAVVLAAGAAMLKLGGWRRLLIVLAAMVAGGILGLFAPLLAYRLALVSSPAAGVVLLLWLGQWVRCRLPLHRRTPPPPPKAVGAPAPAAGKE